ncbi:MAG: cache domain-containing protein [Nostoc sp.]|uniref:cache domain-containing protein n=1 Tax=Nostoc sp. TaxID=1180 RepID=UPI002FFBD8AE
MTEKVKLKHFHRLFYPPAWSITAKISAALVLATLIPMTFTVYYNLRQSLESVKAGEYRKLELLATSNAKRLDQLIIDIERVVVQISTDKDVVNFFASVTPQKQTAFRSSMQRSLDNVFHSNPDYDVIYIMDRKGRCLAATDPTFIGQNYAFREYFQHSLGGHSDVSSLLVGTTSGRPGIYFSNPVRSEDGTIVGVAVLKVKGQDIWAIVNALQAGTGSNAFLVDEHGVIISHPDKSLLYTSLARLPLEKLKQIQSNRQYGLNQIKSLELSELAKVMVRAKQPGHTSYYSTLEQMRLMIGFAPLDEEPWVLGVNKPIALFSAPLNRLIWQSILSLLAVGAIAVIVALLLARSIAKPIRALTKAAQALVKQDDFDADKLVKAGSTTDDIGQLVRVFLEMAQEVKAREQKLKQQVKQLHIEIDEAKRASQVAEITQTDYFQQLHKKARKLKARKVEASEMEIDYFQQLYKKAQNLKNRALEADS